MSNATLDQAPLPGFHRAGFDVRVNIVGFAIDELELNEQFEDWARAGNGRYIEAHDKQELREAMGRSLDVPFEVLSGDEVVATGVVGGDPVVLQAGTYRVRVLGSKQRDLGEVVIEPLSAGPFPVETEGILLVGGQCAGAGEDDQQQAVVVRRTHAAVIASSVLFDSLLLEASITVKSLCVPVNVLLLKTSNRLAVVILYVLLTLTCWTPAPCFTILEDPKKDQRGKEKKHI